MDIMKMFYSYLSTAQLSSFLTSASLNNFKNIPFIENEMLIFSALHDLTKSNINNPIVELTFSKIKNRYMYRKDLLKNILRIEKYNTFLSSLINKNTDEFSQDSEEQEEKKNSEEEKFTEIDSAVNLNENLNDKSVEKEMLSKNIQQEVYTFDSVAMEIENVVESEILESNFKIEDIETTSTESFEQEAILDKVPETNYILPSNPVHLKQKKLQKSRSKFLKQVQQPFNIKKAQPKQTPTSKRKKYSSENIENTSEFQREQISNPQSNISDSYEYESNTEKSENNDYHTGGGEIVNIEQVVS